MKRTVSICLCALASSAILLAGCADGGALEREGTVDSVSAALAAAADDENDAQMHPTIKSALQEISSVPEANGACISAIEAGDSAAVRQLLLEHGADAAYLDKMTIDLNGPKEDAAAEGTNDTLALYVGYIPGDPGSPSQPVGIVKLACCGWVDWNSWIITFIWL